MQKKQCEKIAVVIGTRPEGIKLLPLVKAMRGRALSPLVILSGQHADLLSGVLDAFGERADIALPPMHFGEDLPAMLSHLLSIFGGVFREVRPETVIVQGDTATAYAAALSAFLLRIPILHVEAGLRSKDAFSPFPEESFRRSIASMALFHIAPTPAAMEHLLSEGVPRKRIFLLGNTVEDAVHMLLEKKPKAGKTILFTLHRREHSEVKMREIYSAVRMLSERFPTYSILYPVHPSPRVRRIAAFALAGAQSISLVPPMGVKEFYGALAAAPLVLTDSGGVQEEAAILGIPTLVLRDNTERESELLAGDILLGGTEPSRILALASELLLHPKKKAKESRHGSPSERICNVLLAFKAGDFDMPPLFQEF